jgi:hypothetical protein
MESQELIIVDIFCKECQIEVELIDELSEFGLIPIIFEKGTKYIHIEALPNVEKIIRFHRELHINKEGIEVVLDLLNRLDNMNLQVKQLQDKLNLYE